MTDREILEIILNKIAILETGQAKLEQGQARLEQGQAKLEREVLGVQNAQDNMRLGLRNVRAIIEERFDILESEFKAYRRSTQATIGELQLRQQNLEDEFQELKKQAN